MAFSRLLPRPHARTKHAKGVTTARVIALALVPVAAPGVPIIAASLACLVGLRR